METPSDIDEQLARGVRDATKVLNEMVRSAHDNGLRVEFDIATSEAFGIEGRRPTIITTVSKILR